MAGFKYVHEVLAGIGPHFPTGLCVNDGTTQTKDGTCIALTPDKKINTYVPPQSELLGLRLSGTYRGTLAFSVGAGENTVGPGFSAGLNLGVASDLANREDYSKVTGYETSNGAIGTGTYAGIYADELNEASAVTLEPTLGLGLHIGLGQALLNVDYTASYQRTWWDTYTGDRSGDLSQLKTGNFVHGPQISGGYVSRSGLGGELVLRFGIPASGDARTVGTEKYLQTGSASNLDIKAQLVYRF